MDHKQCNTAHTFFFLERGRYVRTASQFGAMVDNFFFLERGRYERTASQFGATVDNCAENAHFWLCLACPQFPLQHCCWLRHTKPCIIYLHNHKVGLFSETAAAALAACCRFYRRRRAKVGQPTNKQRLFPDPLTPPQCWNPTWRQTDPGSAPRKWIDFWPVTRETHLRHMGAEKTHGGQRL